MVSRPAWSETHRSAGAQAAGPANPSARPVRLQLRYGAGDVQRTGPLLKVGEYLPADLQHRGVVAELGGDFVQFGVGLSKGVRLAPALRGLKVEAVGRFKRLHAAAHAFSKTSRTGMIALCIKKSSLCSGPCSPKS